MILGSGKSRFESPLCHDHLLGDLGLVTYSQSDLPDYRDHFSGRKWLLSRAGTSLLNFISRFYLPQAHGHQSPRSLLSHSWKPSVLACLYPETTVIQLPCVPSSIVEEARKDLYFFHSTDSYHFNRHRCSNRKSWEL